ncbi:hypothetical protein B0H10DRAFT_284586 [Mycena sp. CBHHK59/15]|nr:hypothetical protein B0H10DRAFT_284586 [Mycena sp. CBHHK59/15]
MFTSGSSTFCVVSTGVLGTSTSTATPFSHNVRGIIGVAIGSVVALILGVVTVFFACGWYKQNLRRARAGSGLLPAPQMHGRGVWRSPLEGQGDDDSLAGRASTSAGHGGSGESSDAHALASSQGFGQAGAALAAGIELAGGAASSQGHSTPLTGSATSHGHGSLFLNSHGHAPTSSEHGYVSGSSHVHDCAGDTPRPGLPTLPSSYACTHTDDRKLRGGRPASPQLFALGAMQDPTAPRPPHPPSSLLNPPSPWHAVQDDAALAWNAWRPAAQPLASPALALPEDPAPTEGLLRPSLAVLLPASHSTRTLRDHVDYSRPIGALRMDSVNTFATSSSEG